jgi:3-polyprenyl-4-hydroxybenzoate decarboxylase
MPAFYTRPQTVTELVDTVVHRILDQVGLPVAKAFRWFENTE